MERDLEYVYAVYQMGSFSKAAKFLFASQPTVSMAVQRVEEDLGYPVFDRQFHPLQLTAAWRESVSRKKHCGRRLTKSTVRKRKSFGSAVHR